MSIKRTDQFVHRPVGTTYRQRRLMADLGGGRDGRCLWTVSVVDGASGVLVEAKPVHRANVVVATDLMHHSMLDDVLREVKPLLDGDGWTERTVLACSTAGCDGSQPLFANAEPLPTGVKGECQTCSLRSVRSCVECGGYDDARMANRPFLLARQVCFTCSCWLDLIAKRTPKSVVSDTYHHYVIGDGRFGSKGHGGRKGLRQRGRFGTPKVTLGSS